MLKSGSIISRIHSANSTESVGVAFLDAVMEMLPGYDRGMVYRFREGHNYL